ncbi:hypothetical protein GCM10010402_20570 [Actinomadura luteofluorescens]
MRQLYDQMTEPKWVIAMGVCASSGGMFNNYAVVQGVDHIVPVDVYLSGCPPRPEMLLDAIVKLHDKVQNSKLGAHRRARSGRGNAGHLTGQRTAAAEPAVGGRLPAPPPFRMTLTSVGSLRPPDRTEHSRAVPASSRSPFRRRPCFVRFSRSLTLNGLNPTTRSPGEIPDTRPHRGASSLDTHR